MDSRTIRELMADARERGCLASGAPLARVTDRLGMPGSTEAVRVLHARVTGGFDLQVLPARGLDIGEVFLGGVPVSWFSPVVDTRPLESPRGDDWLRRFNGGLITTCGLENVGPASARGPMHGTASHRPADEVCSRTGDGASGPWAEVAGVMTTASTFGPTLRLERTIRSGFDVHGSPQIRLIDVVANEGPGSASVALLHHVNLGPPLVVPATRIDVPGTEVHEREGAQVVADWRTMPLPLDEPGEAVFEHRDPSVDDEGFATAVITAPSGLELRVCWSATTLPFAYQWMLPTRRRWALAIEPSTAPLFGESRSGDGLGAPALDAGGSRRHEVRVIAAW